MMGFADKIRQQDSLRADLDTGELFLQPVDKLIAACEDKHYLLEDRALLLAELLFRFYLNRDSAINDFLSRILTSESIDCFLLRVETPSGVDFWESGDDSLSGRTLAAIQGRMAKFRTWDGFIPVFEEANRDFGLFLPFILTERTGNDPAAVDFQGNEIPEWNDYCALLSEKWQLRLAADPHKEVGGKSMMLPFLLAVWRKEGILPQYDMKRLLATGAIEDGKLARVGISGKGSAFKQYFGDKAFFLYPATYKEDGIGNWNGGIGLNPGMGMNELQVQIREIIEQKNLAKFNLRYALERLPHYDELVNRTGYAGWSDTAERLANLLNGVSRTASPDEFLQMCMLTATAFCHAGRTDDARKYNGMAFRFATRDREQYRAEYLRLQIDQLVLATDDEDFMKISRVCPELEQDIEQFDDVDLKMRFHGTMGQAHAYGFLAEVPCFEKEKALMHFEQAIKCAKELDDPVELAHDLNYIHLQYAIFAPGSDEEQDAYEDAAAQIANLSDPRAQCNNRNYLCRQKLFAYYRAFLTGAAISGEDIDKVFGQLNSPEAYLEALCRKYRGVVLASDGNTSAARKEFDSAIKTIKGQTWSGVFRCIELTILAEAWFRLHDEQYREEALNLLAEKIAPGFAHRARWENILKQDIPQDIAPAALTYWY